MRAARLGLAAASLLAALAGAATTEPRTPVEHRRGAEQTYLTFPEWYLVHSPAELADYLADARAPSAFPYFGHIGQFWQGYREVSLATRDAPFNGGYHLMVSVIGSSTTVEYGLKALYEATLGRLAEASASHGPTAEDRLAARVAREYVDFIRVWPWYEFAFAARLRELWLDTPAGGADLLRKWERRFALSTEYGAKALYAGLIKLATKSIYDEPLPTTAVVLNHAPLAQPGLPHMRLLSADANGVLATLPRYEAFTHYAAVLAGQGLNFEEIAGNRGPVLVSLLRASAAPAEAAEQARLLFSQPILTRPGQERRVLAVPVPQLAAQLRRWQAEPGVKLEHVYDY